MTDQASSPSLGGLPRFGTPPPGEEILPDADPDLGPESPPAPPTTAGAPSTTSSPQPPPPPAATRPTSADGPSSPGSTDGASPAGATSIDEALEMLGAGLFQLLGLAMNKLVRRRRPGVETTLWLVDEAEAEAFGSAAAALTANRLPAELQDEARAPMVAGGVVLASWGLRNAMGVTLEDLRRAEGAGNSPPPAAGPWAPQGPPPPPPPPARTVVHVASQGPPPAVHYDTVDPAPDPSRVIDPAI